MALQGFDKAYYLGAKLAELQATQPEWVGKDADFLETVLSNVYGLTAEEHYAQYGWQEGLAPNQYFSAAEYKLAKAQQLFDSGSYLTLNSALAAFEQAWDGQDPYQHYLQWGAGEAINPSNAFDATQYFADKLAALQADPATAAEWADKTATEVQDAFLAAGLTAIEHFMLYGEDEGLTITPVPADEQVDAGEMTPMVGETFTLTAGVDTVAGTAGNDTINAFIDTTGTSDRSTFTAQDTIDGGAGTDTLNIFTDNVGSVNKVFPAFATVKNVEIVNVYNDNTAAAFGDAAKFQGVQQLWQIGAATDVTNLGASTAAGFRDVAALSQTVTTATGNTAATIALDDSTGTLTTSGATTVSVVGEKAAAAFTLNVNGTGTATALTVDTAVATTIAKNTDAAVTLNAGDSTGAITIAETTSLQNITTGTGNDTIAAAGATVKSISTGAGNDTVTINTNALSATSTIDLGAGNDRLVLNFAPTAGVTLSGGEGTDTLAVAKATYTTVSGFSPANLAKITGFEVLEFTDALAGGDSFDIGKVAGITSFVAGAGVTTGSSATITGVTPGSSVTLAGNASNNGTLVVAVKDAATGENDVLNLKLNKDYTEDNDGTSTITPVSTHVTASNVETLNVESTGKASATFAGAAGNKADGVNNTLSLTNDDLVTLNVTGNQAFSFTSNAAMTELATIDASSVALQATTEGVAVTIDASAHVSTSTALTIIGSATGKNVITGGATDDVIIGGAASDTIISSEGADTITLGGGNDIYKLGAATDSVVNARDVITDFNANTVGQGTNGAATTAGAAAVAARNGDVIDLTEFNPTLVNVAVLTNASDATTFLANSAGAAAGVAVNVALDSSTGTLYIDGLDDGVADSVLMLTGVTTIDAAAFLV
ncbi:beta strand repeat-containing protein [Pelovirga terrestris]|uniref:Calcium-binding protein n=1 Tax=Pelovirga terrestris TaxID=2771352 RepID=A0A8J6QZG9_9BACT|nr:calcium-binding protein [Pelovirga terrestris]MBD1401322.1 calcium-binding protein [Pelovirga terrestris]